MPKSDKSFSETNSHKFGLCVYLNSLTHKILKPNILITVLSLLQIAFFQWEKGGEFQKPHKI